MVVRNLFGGVGRTTPIRSPSARAGDSAEALPKVVAVVEDDPAVCAALDDLLSSIGLRVETFSSAQELLSQFSAERIHCMVLDVRLPGKSGLELYEDLIRANLAPPVIFISGYADVRMSVRAMKAGAMDFLAKPFGEQELLDSVQAAIRHDQIRRENGKIVAEVQRRFNSLTAREQEMMTYVVSGRRNKEIAADMGVTEITVKAHRNQVMRKMLARSVAELIGMAQILGQEAAQAMCLISSALREHSIGASS